jgi:hypothetical protein
MTIVMSAGMISGRAGASLQSPVTGRATWDTRRVQRRATGSFPPWHVVVFLTLAGALAAWWAFHGSVTNYDTQWSLTWARDLVEGRTPGYELPGAATPHPLTTALALLAQVTGIEAAGDVMRASIYVSAGAVLALVAVIAHRLGGPGSAVLAVAALAVAAPFAVATAIAFQDVLAAALVALAVALAMAAPRRAVPPLVVLAAAGLVRPEMWGLAACWWLVQFPGRDMGERARLALLAAAGPLLWAATDFAVTGDPLFSFHHTRDGAAVAERVTGAANGPRVLYDNLREIFGRWVLLGGLLGIVGLAWSGWRRRGAESGWGALVVPATTGLLVLAFLILAVGNVSLLARYLLPLAALLAVGFGVAAGGWLASDAPLPLRGAWAAAGAFAVLASIQAVRSQLDLVEVTVREVRISGTAYADLRDLGREPPLAARGVRCGRLATTNARTEVALAEVTGRSPAAIDVRPRGGGRRGPATLVLPATVRVRDAAELNGAKGGALVAPPPGARRVAANSSWRAYAIGC